MALTLRDLEYVTALADTGQFITAAERCGVSQPTLSTQVAKVEAALGVLLFERARRGVIPTDAGREVVDRARTILLDVRELTARARAPRAAFGGRLRLGAISTAAPYLVPHILPVFRAAYPGVELYIREGLTEPLLEQLHATVLDVVVVSPPFDGDGLEECELGKEEFVVALPPGHALAAQREVAAADLAAQRILLLEEGHCMRDQALALCEWSRASVDVTVHGSSVEGLRQMVSLGIGCTFLPKLATIGPFADAAPTVIRPLRQPRPTRGLVLAWRRTHPRTGELRALGAILGNAIHAGAAEASRESRTR